MAKQANKAKSQAPTISDNSSLVTRLIFDSPRSLFIGTLLTVLFIKVGTSPIPNFGVVAAIASNPFQYPTPQDPDGFYQMWNWLTPYLAYLLHLNTGNKFLALHFILAIGFIAIVTIALFRKLPEHQARTAFIIFLAMPVSGSVLFWICYDAPALFLMALALFVFKNKYALFALGVLLGMQDFEPTVVSFSAILLATWLSKKNSENSDLNFKSPSFVIAGAITGRLILTILFDRWNLQATSGRLAWFQKHLNEMSQQVMQSPGLCLWAILGLAWVVLFLHIASDIKISRTILIPILFLSVLVFTTADKTRVMALATFPLLSVMWLKNESFLKAFNKKVTVTLGLIWLVAPWVFIWETNLYTSTFFGEQPGLQSTMLTLRAIFGF